VKIEILFEDENYIAVNKPAPLLVHRTPGDKDTINLLKLVKEQTGHYLYPIHRLDKQVSGVIIFGLNPQAVRDLQSHWHSDKIQKKYKALVKGNIEKSGTHNFALHDEKKIPKDAITHYTPIDSFERATLVDIRIETGRYHQIRRHFSRRMQHIIGDRRYGKKINNDYFKDNYGLMRMFLHSYELRIKIEELNLDLTLKAPLANDLQEVLNKINSISC